MGRKYHKGGFTPVNPSKYVGDIESIVYRSGWERNYMKYCDENPAILSWNSEDVIIKYLSPVDNRVHRYHIDFYIKYKDSSGNVCQALIEVKPHIQTLVPKRGKKRQRTYMNECKTYLVNQAKWKYATEFAESKGIKFIILTEKNTPSLLL